MTHFLRTGISICRYITLCFSISYLLATVICFTAAIFSKIKKDTASFESGMNSFIECLRAFLISVLFFAISIILMIQAPDYKNVNERLLSEGVNIEFSKRDENVKKLLNGETIKYDIYELKISDDKLKTGEPN